MKARWRGQRLAWVLVLWAGTGLVLPTVIVREGRCRAQSDSIDRTAQQVVRATMQPDGLSRTTVTATDSAGTAKDLLGSPTGPDLTPPNAMTRDPATANSTANLFRPGPVLSGTDVVPAIGSLGSEDGTAGAETRSKAAPGGSGVPAPTPTIRLQDDALAESSATSGVSLGTIGLGVLAVGGATAATLAIIDANTNEKDPKPASP